MSRSLRGRAVHTLVGAIVAVVGLLGLVAPAVAATDGTLVVAVVGAGSVSSQPPGITCPGRCAASFPAGTSVALVPKPNRGSALLRWGGACTGKAGCRVAVTALSVVAAQFSGSSGVAPVAVAPVPRGILTSGVPVSGDVTSGAGLTFRFIAVTGLHVTLAIANPHTSPSGARLQINVYDSSGATDTGGAVFSTGPTEIDFTPTASQAGLTKVVVAPYDGGATGRFTLTYAMDVTGKLVSGVPTHGDLTVEGQEAAYTFTAVTGQHLTLAISKPSTAPSGNRLQINVYDSSGATDTGGAVFSTGPTEIDFTPTASQAGPTKVVVAPYDGGTTGSFELTYATDIVGKLRPNVPVHGTIRWEGQEADYAFHGCDGPSRFARHQQPQHRAARESAPDKRLRLKRRNRHGRRGF